MPDQDRLIHGTWHIVRSSLTMWRRRAGAISYCPLPDGSVADIVTSRKGGRTDHILGIDRAIDADGWQWEWKGVQPLTVFVRSRWCFVAGDAEAGWAVTLFEKTLFSAAGIDIYSRDATIDPDRLAVAVQACARHPMAREYRSQLFEPPRWEH